MSIPRKLEWDSYEHIHTEKHPDWFWMVSIVVATIAILSIYFHNYLFAIIVIIGGFTGAMHAHIPPKLRHYELTPRGLLIDSLLYPYIGLDSFWIEENEGKLLIKSKKIMMPLLVIHIHPEDAELIRDFLLHYLDEEEHHEPLLQKLLEYVGF